MSGMYDRANPIPFGKDVPLGVRRWHGKAMRRYYQLDSTGFWRMHKNGVRMYVLSHEPYSQDFMNSQQILEVFPRSLRVQAGL
jgi:hypothetical protein